VFVLIPSLALAQPEVRRSPVSINRVLDRVIDMPVKKVTSVMLGGPNLDVLYLNVISTAKPPPLPRFLSDGALRGGSLFAVYDLCARGVPEPGFAS
jgi:L-arabinonolactonase